MDMKNTSVNAGEDFYYYIKREYNYYKLIFL